MDYEIMKGLEALNEVLPRPARVIQPPELAEKGERICMLSRALYSRYVDAVLWRGSIDKATREAVADALDRAVACLPDMVTDKDGNPQRYAVKLSVTSRRDDFKDLPGKLAKARQSETASARGQVLP
jgi:hypothetical protein